MKLTNKSNAYTLLIICAYLPPENSTWGNNANEFYHYLLTITYEHCECDMIVLCGDFNSRIGNTIDYIKNIDDVTDRAVLDSTMNKHGKD